MKFKATVRIITAANTAARLAAVSPTARPAPANGLLLIDGQPRWIWLTEQDVELL